METLNAGPSDMCVVQRLKVKMKGLNFFTVLRLMGSPFDGENMTNYTRDSLGRKEAGLRLGPEGVVSHLTYQSLAFL